MFTLSQKFGSSCLAFISLSLLISTVMALDYMFVPEDSSLLSACSGSDADSFNLLDLSKSEVDMLDDDVIELKGIIGFKWKLSSSDNFELIANTFKEQGSEYVPTVFNTNRRDGCRTLFVEGEPWYESLTQYVVEEDRVCPAQGEKVLWHFNPGSFALTFRNIEGGNKEGNYKIVVHMKPYDQAGKYYDDLSLCFSILGFLSKI